MLYLIVHESAGICVHSPIDLPAKSIFISAGSATSGGGVEASMEGGGEGLAASSAHEIIGARLRNPRRNIKFFMSTNANATEGARQTFKSRRNDCHPGERTLSTLNTG